jgi:hypothetical protein
MRRIVIWTITILLVAGAGYYWWLVSENKISLPGPVMHYEQNRLKNYQSASWDFSIDYPKRYLLVKPDEAGLTYFTGQQTPDAEILVPSTEFPGTNFNDSYVVVAADPSVKNANDCKKYANGAANLKTTDKSQDINRNKFDEADFTGAAAGNIYETRLFRIFHGGTCYEISATLHTSNIGNYETGTVTEVDKNAAWDKLMQIINSFKFTR